MSLDLGSLVAYLSVDDAPMEQGIASGESRLKGFATGAVKILGGAGLAAGGAFGAALAANMRVEAANDKMAAALGLTEEQSKVAGKVAGRLYANAYGESMEDTAAAVEAVMSSIKGMRDASTADLREVTAGAMNLAKAMEVDVSAAANVAGNWVTNGLAKNAIEALDLLTAGMQKVPKELRGDIMEVGNEYSQIFSQLGLSGEQAMAALVSGADKGAWGIDKAADALKELTIRSTDGSKTTTQAYKAMGLDASTMANDMLAGGSRAAAATQKIVKGLLDVEDPARRANMSITLFGAPLEDMGTKSIPKFLSSLKDGGDGLGRFAGANKRMGKQLNDNAGHDFKVAIRQIKALGMSLVTWAMPYVSQFADYLKKDLVPQVKDAAHTFSEEWVPKIKDAAQWIKVHLIPAIKDLANWLKDKLIPGVVDVVGWFAKHKSATKALAVTIGVLYAITKVHAAVMAVEQAGGLLKVIKSTRVVTALTKTYTAVQWALNAAYLANPVGLVVLGIVALIAILIIAWKKSDKFREVVTNAFEKVKEWGIKLVDWFKGLPDKMAKAAHGLWDGIKNGFRSAINWIIEKWNNFELRIPEITIPIPGADDIKIGGYTMSTPNIPMLAKGGITNGPMLSVVGDNPGGREVVSPLDDMFRMLDKAYAHGANGGGAQAARGPVRTILRVGERDFVAYLEDVAEAVIESAAAFTGSQTRAGAYA